MIKTIGKVFINGTQFTTDPKIQRNWTPRKSEHKGLGGANTVQDWNRFGKDMRLSLTSDGNYINQDFKAYLDGLVAVRGATYAYRDYQGIEGTVVIMNFDAKATFIGDGQGVLFEYTLELKIITLSKLDFATYSGGA